MGRGGRGRREGGGGEREIKGEKAKKKEDELIIEYHVSVWCTVFCIS